MQCGRPEGAPAKHSSGGQRMIFVSKRVRTVDPIAMKIPICSPVFLSNESEIGKVFVSDRGLVSA